MSENNLCCNAHKCHTLLNGRIWVTRCLHLFCPEHGATYFQNKSQTSCPVCTEVLVKESDVLLCQTNPSDMVLAGLRPEKVIRLVENSFKLWKCQLDAERHHDSSKINILTKHLEESVNSFKKALHKKDIEYTGQIAALQANYNDVMIKLKQANQELELAKSSLRKYKVAYDSLVSHRAHRNGADMGPSHFPLDSLLDESDSKKGQNELNISYLQNKFYKTEAGILEMDFNFRDLHNF